ncbi:MAG: tRNA nucleotidyltransferase/poly(A) polymerase family protein [Solirubrobacteraceae bacterium]
MTFDASRNGFGGAGANSRVDVLAALQDQPGGSQLLDLADTHPEVALIGGAVRDLLLGRTPRELDVVVADESAAFAADLARRLDSDATVTQHERFGTALVQWKDGRIDIAQRRTETYSAAGALPNVQPGTLEQDLARRDFTVNAIAVPLAGPTRGQLTTAAHALEDLHDGRLRVLHERSFIDDPTRLLRLARYSARLGFTVEPHTAELAAQALAAGAFAAVSRARIGAELRLALGEADALGALTALDRVGVLRAIEPRLALDACMAARALQLLPADGRADLLLMASLLLGLAVNPHEDPEPVMYELLDGLEFTAGDRERTMRAALVAPGLFKELTLAAKPSEMHEALSAHTIEAIALGGAMGVGTSSVTAEVEIWFERLRHVRLDIGGQDLLAAGIPAGPQIGRRLSHALARKMDGELPAGREAELAAALESDAP